MAIVLTNNQNYTDIANAIREKLGVETTYMPSEMAAAILSISGGGGIHADVNSEYSFPALPISWVCEAVEQE